MQKEILLTDTVRKVLINLNEHVKASNDQIVQLYADMFYKHFQSDIINHTPIKQFIIGILEQEKRVKKINRKNYKLYIDFINENKRIMK